MKRVLRVLAAVALALGGAVGLAGTAQATDGCEGEGGYWAGGVCSLEVEVQPVCDGAVARLLYSTVVADPSVTELTVTWVNPGGDDVVVSGLPLEGSLAWPTHAWAKGTVQVLIDANVQAATTVTYPATGACAPSGQGGGTLGTGGGAPLANGTGGGVLASTGGDVVPFLAVAGALVALGAVTLVAVRRTSTQG